MEKIGEAPMYCIGNTELLDKPKLGTTIICPHCGKEHAIEYGKDGNGDITKTLAFYKCGSKYYLAGVNGKDLT